MKGLIPDREEQRHDRRQEREEGQVGEDQADLAGVVRVAVAGDVEVPGRVPAAQQPEGVGHRRVDAPRRQAEEQARHHRDARSRGRGRRPTPRGARGATARSPSPPRDGRGDPDPHHDPRQHRRDGRRGLDRDRHVDPCRRVAEPDHQLQARIDGRPEDEREGEGAGQRRRSVRSRARRRAPVPGGRRSGARRRARRPAPARAAASSCPAPEKPLVRVAAARPAAPSTRRRPAGRPGPRRAPSGRRRSPARSCGARAADAPEDHHPILPEDEPPVRAGQQRLDPEPVDRGGRCGRRCRDGGCRRSPTARRAAPGRCRSARARTGGRRRGCRPTPARPRGSGRSRAPSRGRGR